MTIPREYQGRFIYHFTHIDNLQDILKHGFVAKNHPSFPGRVRSIAAESIQGRRADKRVTCGPGGVVHNYVPLYFGAVSPMLLAVINSKNIDQRDILYFEFPINLIDRNDAVFTDAAANANVDPIFYEDPADLRHLDWGLIDSRSWGEPDPLRKRKRMAEALVHHHLPLSLASRCVVLDDAARLRVRSAVGGAPFPLIATESYPRYHFYWKPWKRDESLLKGPREVAEIFRSTAERVYAGLAAGTKAAKFLDLDNLLTALRANYQALPHTAELVGLESANAVHTETVDIHTRQVVDKLLTLPEFQALGPKKRRDVELAAHLHDIGKGPKSRWPEGKQEVDADHPVAAMPMMEDILLNQVQTVSRKSAQRLLKLVCYHDLVGDVLSQRKRDKQQIIDLCDDEGELDMLFALGRADASVLREVWGNEGVWDTLRRECADAIRRK